MFCIGLFGGFHVGIITERYGQISTQFRETTVQPFLHSSREKVSITIRHLDRFSGFCKLRDRDRQTETDRQTDRRTTLLLL